MSDKLVALGLASALFLGLLGACELTQLTVPAPTPTPTKTPTPTATVTASPTPTITPTPTVNIWQLNMYPDRVQVAGLLGEIYGGVAILNLGLEPDDSLFVLFATAEGELLWAEIAAVEGQWAVVRIYPGTQPTPTPEISGTKS